MEIDDLDGHLGQTFCSTRARLFSVGTGPGADGVSSLAADYLMENVLLGYSFANL